MNTELVFLVVGTILLLIGKIFILFPPVISNYFPLIMMVLPPLGYIIFVFGFLFLLALLLIVKEVIFLNLIKKVSFTFVLCYLITTFITFFGMIFHPMIMKDLKRRNALIYLWMFDLEASLVFMLSFLILFIFAYRKEDETIFETLDDFTLKIGGSIIYILGIILSLGSGLFYMSDILFFQLTSVTSLIGIFLFFFGFILILIHLIKKKKEDYTIYQKVIRHTCILLDLFGYILSLLFYIFFYFLRNSRGFASLEFLYYSNLSFLISLTFVTYFLVSFVNSGEFPMNPQ